MISITVSAHFYFKHRLPSDSSKIIKKLDSEFIQSRFHVVEARKAGYNDDEISNELATRFNKEYSDNMSNLITVEATVFLVCIFIGVGLIIIKKEPIGKQK